MTNYGDNRGYPRFQIVKRSSMESGHHKFWRVKFLANETSRPKQLATYVKWERALKHVETAIERFGRGRL